MGLVIALVSKVTGVNNLNLTTTRGDRLIETRPPLCGWLWAGFDQTNSTPAIRERPGTQTRIKSLF